MKRNAVLIAALLVLMISLAAPWVFSETPPGPVESLKAKLESWDVEEAWPEAQEALAKDPQDPDLIETASLIAYNRGDYPESLKLIKRAIEVGGENEDRRGFALFVEQTINVLAPYKQVETPHFTITFDERQDGILVDYLTDGLEKTYRAMAEEFGFRPREKVRVELFPDARAFYLASALSARDIEVTGAVGLTKFNKLQFLSPRALLHGYRWLDAISHEYMHYLLMKMTANKAPIWFHEGFAKYEETRWRKGPPYLTPLYRTLLSQAQSEKKLIAFADMEPSLLHLETPEEVQLAYAEGASAIDFIIHTVGHEGLRKILDAMARGSTKGAAASIREVMGLAFSQFEEKWAGFLAAKGLEPVAGSVVRPFKVSEGGADDERMDLEEIKSLVARNRTHLGDRLRERGRTDAALLEYRRALAETRESVPVMNRLSSALIALGRDEEALDTLKRILQLAPDHPTPYTQLGQIHLRLKDFNQAKAAFEESLQINPFDPRTHVGLANAYATLGDDLGAARERGIVQRLER